MLKWIISTIGFLIWGIISEFEYLGGDRNIAAFLLYVFAIISFLAMAWILRSNNSKCTERSPFIDESKSWILCISSFTFAWIICLVPIKSLHNEDSLKKAFGLLAEKNDKNQPELLTAYLTSGLLTNKQEPKEQEPILLTNSKFYKCSWTQDSEDHNASLRERLGGEIFSIKEIGVEKTTDLATKPSGLQKNVELRVGKIKADSNGAEGGDAQILSILVKRISDQKETTGQDQNNWEEAGYALVITSLRGVTEENWLTKTHKLNVLVYEYGKKSDKKIILDSTGDWLPLLTVSAPGCFTGLNTVSVHSDEEAIATWFLSIIDREEKLKELDSKKDLQLELSQEDKKRLFRFTADSLRITLAGWKAPLPPEGKYLMKRPTELASELRWAAWIHGADPFGTRILFLIYWFGATAVVIFIIRLICFWPWRTKSVRFDSAKECRDCKDSLGIFHGFSDFLVYALPSIGFLGTIAGLGAAFGTVGIVSSVSELQKMSLMDVLLNLGTAFSTTFFGLIAGLVASLCFMVNDINEGQLLNKIDEYEASLQETANGDANESS